MAPGWIKEAVAAYKGNPVALRDFRVQFRNGRVVLLLLIYTALLTLIASSAYSMSQGFSGQSVSAVQSSLNTTYIGILAALYVMVSAISAFSSAFSVVAERNRKALDLVFSAPFSPRRYVIGKMISGLRYAGILIVLALPALSTMVAAGGATIEDILLHALLLAANAMAWSAVGIAIASCSRNFMLPLGGTLVAALIWNYLTASFGMIFGLSTSGFFGPGSGSGNPSWLTSLSLCSGALGMVVPTQTVDLFSLPVPAWAPAFVLLLLLTRLGVTAAIAGLEYPVILAGFWLRITGALYTLGLSLLISFCLPASMTGFNQTRPFSIALGIFSLLGLFSLLFTAPFGPDKEQKIPDKTGLDFRAVLQPRSGSALAYALLLMACWWAPFMVMHDYLREPQALVVAVHACVFMGFWVAVLRLFSMLFKTAALARVLAVVLFAVMSVAAVLFSVIWYSNSSGTLSSLSILDLSFVRPWLGETEAEAIAAWVHVLALTILTIFIFVLVEYQRAKRPS